MARTITEEKKNGRGRGRPPITVNVVSDAIVDRAAKAAPAPTPESGRKAFMRIAERRMNDLLAKLTTLGKLSSSKSKYGYTDDDVEHIRATLINAVNATCDRLRRVKAKPGFKFARESGDNASA